MDVLDGQTMESQSKIGPSSDPYVCKELVVLARWITPLLAQTLEYKQWLTYNQLKIWGAPNLDIVLFYIFLCVYMLFPPCLLEHLQLIDMSNCYMNMKIQKLKVKAASTK